LNSSLIRVHPIAGAIGAEISGVDLGNQRDVYHEVRPCCSVGGVRVHIRLQIGVLSVAVAGLSDATLRQLP
jgi:hypothetical protein